MLFDLRDEMLRTDGLHPDPLQPRRTFQLDQHEALKASIAAHGILQSLLVRWDAERKQHWIIAGERRWRCAQELSIEWVPCRVIDQALQSAEILTLELVENLLREELGPLDEARGLQRLQGLLKCSREALAVQVQRSPASVCRSFKLLELPSEVQALIEVGSLPVSVATELHACRDPQLQRELAEKYVAGGMIREDVAAAVQHANAETPRATAKTVLMPLAKGMSLRVPAAASLKECEQAVMHWLRRLRAAKQAETDLPTFAAAWRNNAASES